jgi:hypothetical protein
MAVEAAKSPTDAFAKAAEAFLFRSQVWVSYNALERIGETHHELLETLSACTLGSADESLPFLRVCSHFQAL